MPQLVVVGHTYILDASDKTEGWVLDSSGKIKRPIFEVHLTISNTLCLIA